MLCIIAIVMIANVIRAYLKHRYKKPEVDTEVEETLAKRLVIALGMRIGCG